MENRDFSASKNPGNDLVGRSKSLGVTSAYLASDLATALFPKSEVLLSDRILSNSRQYIRAILSEIESRLCLIATEKLSVAHESIIEIGNSQLAYSFPHLRDAGLLNRKNILDHIFVQVQKTELTNRLLQKVSQEDLENGLSRFLDHEEKGIAEAAMSLLVSQNRSGSPLNAISYRLEDVPAEILHDLTWSVTAAIQKLSRFDSSKMLEAAEILLAEHDESKSRNVRAQRLAGLLEHSTEKNSIPHPLKDGLDLFVARLSLRSGVSAEQLILFTAEPNMARIILVMRALNVADQDALSIFAALDVSGNILTASTYNEISRDQALSLVESWSTDPVFQSAELALSLGNLEIDD